MPFVPEENSAGSACWKRDCTTEEIGAAKFKMTYTYKELDKKVQELITAGQGQMKRIQELERELKNHYHGHGVPEMTEEKRICPFTLNNSKWMGGHGCLEEKCMAWEPPHEEKHLPGNGNDYIRDWPGYCKLIE